MKTYYYQAKEPVVPSAFDPDKPLPDWYRLAPAGVIKMRDGIEVLIDEEACRRVAGYIKEGGVDLVVDYEHQTRSDPPVPAPAAGWIKEIRWDNGISARIVWNHKAEQYLREREYRYFSNGFLLSKADDDTVRLLHGFDHVALTNVPRVINNEPLLAKSGKGKNKTKEESDLDLLKQLVAITALGLSENATAEEALAAIEKMVAMAEDKNKERENEGMTEEMVPAKVAAALGLEKGVSVDLVLAKLDLLSTRSSPADDIKLELAKLRDEVASRRAEDLLNKYSRKITPAMLKKTRDDGKSFYLELAKSDPEGLEMIVQSLPDQVPEQLPGADKRSKPIDGASLSADQLVIAKSFGITPEEFAKGLEVENG